MSTYDMSTYLVTHCIHKNDNIQTVYGAINQLNSWPHI